MGYEVVPFSIPTTKSLLGHFLIFFVRTKWYDAMAATWRRRRRPPFRPRSRLRAAPGSRRASPTLLARPPSGMSRSFEWHSIVQVDQVPQRSFRGLLMSKCTAHAYSLLAACIFSLILCFCFALACAQFSSTPAFGVVCVDKVRRPWSCHCSTVCVCRSCIRVLQPTVAGPSAGSSAPTPSPPSPCSAGRRGESLCVDDA